MMKTSIAVAWAGAIVGVAVLNMIGVLPDWMTVAAILTMPLASSLRSSSLDCGRSRHG